MDERALLAEAEAARDGERQAERLDEERHRRQEPAHDVAAEEDLDLGNAGVEGERREDVDEGGRGEGEQDLRDMGASEAGAQEGMLREVEDERTAVAM